VPFDEKTSSTRGTKPESPVRGKTLSWGELEGQIEAASRLAWPGRSEPLPDASAVRGGTIPWGTTLEDLVPDSFGDLASALRSAADSASRRT
jgi:hypothetical protein